MLIPDWLQRTLPANSIHDDTLLAEVDALCKELPQSVNNLTNLLAKHYHSARYTELANHVAVAVWPLIPEWLNHENANLRKQLLAFARQHLPMRLAGRICRRLAKDPDRKVRNFAIVAGTQRSRSCVALARPGRGLGHDRLASGHLSMSIIRRHASGNVRVRKASWRSADCQHRGLAGTPRHPLREAARLHAPGHTRQRWPVCSLPHSETRWH